MRRLFPAPLLSIGLLALWLLLNLSLAAGQIALGALFAFLAPLLMAPLRPSRPRIHNPLAIARLLGRVGIDVVVCNLRVARQVWGFGRHAPRSAFVKVPLDLHDATGLATLAMITTVVPGTVWSQLSLDRSVLLMHVLDLADEDQFIAHFKSTYEQPLKEIFE